MGDVLSVQTCPVFMIQNKYKCALYSSLLIHISGAAGLIVGHPFDTVKVSTATRAQ